MNISEGRVCKGGVNRLPPVTNRPLPPKGQGILNKEVDYRELLSKYIAYVYDNEGATFINYNRCSHVLNAEEMAILDELEGPALEKYIV